MENNKDERLKLATENLEHALGEVADLRAFSAGLLAAADSLRAALARRPAAEACTPLVALTLAQAALDSSKPTHAHYPEPVARHIAAQKAVAEALRAIVQPTAVAASPSVQGESIDSERAALELAYIALFQCIPDVERFPGARAQHIAARNAVSAIIEGKP